VDEEKLIFVYFLQINNKNAANEKNDLVFQDEDS